jgi:Fe-S cluster biogenesis protein NfuA
MWKARAQPPTVERVTDRKDNPAESEVARDAPTARHDLAGFLGDIESLEAISATWDEGARSAMQAYRRAIEALHGEAMARMIRALKAHPSALAALKEAAGDEIVYAVLRRHGLVKPSLNERIESALESVRPALAAHGGDVRVIRIEPPTVEIRLIGSCEGCASSALTFQAGIRKAIQEACPEITDIVQARGQARSRTAALASWRSHASSSCFTATARW